MNMNPWALNLLGILISASLSASAAKNSQNGFESTQVAQYGSYYTVSEAPALLSTGFAKIQAIRLTQWIRHEGDPQQPAEAYDRKKDFGTWINDRTDDVCFNTRAKVLFRDSISDVVLSQKNECLIEQGQWLDPYTGELIHAAAKIQVDHMVPLKHAYVSGAWNWSRVKRCAYANFMGNSFHLISVDSFENMSKGDKAPDQYIPPNDKYVCTYLQSWLKVKTIWNLTLSPPETRAIAASIEEHGCKASGFAISKAELDRQRAKIAVYEDICTKNLN